MRLSKAVVTGSRNIVRQLSNHSFRLRFVLHCDPPPFVRDTEHGIEIPTEFRREAVRLALTGGLAHKLVAADLGIGFSTLSGKKNTNAN